MSCHVRHSVMNVRHHASSDHVQTSKSSHVEGHAWTGLDTEQGIQLERQQLLHRRKAHNSAGLQVTGRGSRGSLYWRTKRSSQTRRGETRENLSVPETLERRFLRRAHSVTPGDLGVRSLREKTQLKVTYNGPRTKGTMLTCYQKQAIKLNIRKRQDKTKQIKGILTNTLRVFNGQLCDQYVCQSNNSKLSTI